MYVPGWSAAIFKRTNPATRTLGDSVSLGTKLSHEQMCIPKAALSFGTLIHGSLHDAEDRVPVVRIPLNVPFSELLLLLIFILLFFLELFLLEHLTSMGLPGRAA